MPKNSISKDEIKTRVLKLKTQLFCEHKSEQEKYLAHKYLNQVLDIIEEYRL